MTPLESWLMMLGISIIVLGLAIGLSSVRRGKEDRFEERRQRDRR